MRSGSRSFVVSTALLIALGAGLLPAAAASGPQAAGDEVVAPDGKAPEAFPSDRTLAAFQTELLALAFEAATAIPVQPHVKDRSRAQEVVVTAYLELDQPRRALDCLPEIANWRRGTGFADVAFYLAAHGSAAAAEAELEHARQVVDDAASGITQDWQRDRILAKIARTQVQLGLAQPATPFGAGLAPSEAGELETAKAMLLPVADFDAQMTSLDGVLATGDFDQVQNVLKVYARYFDRFYADAERRTKLEETVKASWGRLPIPVRVELLLDMARSAVEHADDAHALELLDEMQLVLDGNRWAPEARIPLMARLAALRDRAGAREAARHDADAALALFGSEREAIVDIDRAGALRPLAEAYHSMGDTPAALAVYATALREGARNPNARPRAEDLSATCASMARTGVEPDAATRELIEHIRAGLGTPW